MSNKIPDCFDSLKQFQDYKSTGGLRHVGAKHHCQDCTPAYQRKMIEDERCEHPAVMFRTFKGELIGMRPKDSGYVAAEIKDKALSFLRRDKRGKTLTEISKGIGIPKSSLFRYLQEMIKHRTLKRRVINNGDALYSLL